jgi:flotillin
VIAFKVGNDEESIVNAGQRFLSDQDQMSVLTGRIFAGHLRSIIGSMTVEEIVTERQKLASEVLDGSKAEMAKIGLIVDSLQIQSIDDMGAGYIAAMAAPNNAAIQRQAKIAQAAGRPGGGRGAAGLGAQAGGVRQGDLRRAGPVQGRDRQGAGRSGAGGPAGQHERPARGHPRRPSWPPSRPSCASSSWSPRSSSPPRPRPNGSRSWPRPMPSALASTPRPPRPTTASRSISC